MRYNKEEIRQILYYHIYGIIQEGIRFDKYLQDLDRDLADLIDRYINGENITGKEYRDVQLRRMKGEKL